MPPTKSYRCEKCNFECSKKSNFDIHLTTRKHNTDANTDINATVRATPTSTSGLHMCKCGNSYKHRQSLHTHKKVCDIINCNDAHDIDVAQNNNPHPPQPLQQLVDASLVLELLKQNQFLEAVKDGKIGNTTNNTNTNCNNKFNLNVFLNETCKDAITMDDFINSFEVTREDFLHTGQVGFVEGISTVMTHRFRDMDMHTRPLHCTDLKRETIYIKNADKWEKDDADKTYMRKAVRGVARKNMKELWKWFHDSKPEVEQIGTDVCEKYFAYHKASLGGYGKEEDLKFEDKIMKNVLKDNQIDKNIICV